MYILMYTLLSKNSFPQSLRHLLTVNLKEKKLQTYIVTEGKRADKKKKKNNYKYVVENNDRKCGRRLQMEISINHEMYYYDIEFFSHDGLLVLLPTTNSPISPYQKQSATLARVEQINGAHIIIIIYLSNVHLVW